MAKININIIIIKRFVIMYAYAYIIGVFLLSELKSHDVARNSDMGIRFSSSVVVQWSVCSSMQICNYT